jgi:hypothetical protein
VYTIISIIEMKNCDHIELRIISYIESIISMDDNY